MYSTEEAQPGITTIKPRATVEIYIKEKLQQQKMNQKYHKRERMN